MKVALRHIVTMRVMYAVLAVPLVGLLSYGGYNYYLLKNAYDVELSSNANLQYEFGELRDKLKASDALNNDLKTLLLVRQQEKEAIGQQVQSLSSTVGTLDKLAHTDKELLENYSSVYFLNENYIPKSLGAIDAAYLSRPGEPEYFLANVMPHLTDLLKAAASDNAPMQVLSAYRSYGKQSSLKNSYKITYGAGTANSFSADQGYSEHQLGTAVDFSESGSGGALSGFEKTADYTWLTQNAYKYGFSLSYPQGNTHFVFEPWHWRYVGIELAKKLHDENKNLYDLDQRDIDTYLVKFFDVVMSV